MTPTPTPADLRSQEQAILEALGAIGGQKPVTALALAAKPGVVLSQTMISQVWRHAGFTPTPPGLLIADPWFAGQSRMIVGLLVAGAAGGTSMDVRQRIIPGGLKIAVFAVGQRQATGRSKDSERQQIAALRGRQQVFDESLAVASEATRLAKRPRGVADEVAAVEVVRFLSDLRAEVPPEFTVQVIASVAPGPVIEVWASRQQRVVLRHTPTDVAWSALFTRCAAATVSMLEARGIPSPLPAAAVRLRAECAAPAPFSCGGWRRPDDVPSVLAVLGRRRPRARRSAPPAQTWQVALQGLRDRRSPDFPADLPAYEFLIALRQRSRVEPLVKSDLLAALVVWNDLSITRDRCEAQLIAFNIEAATNSTQSKTAPLLGLGSAGAVGLRRRRLASGSPPGRRGRRATPDPRNSVVLDEEGRRRDVVRDVVDELQAWWVDDLVDHESLIERIPARDDVFGMIAYIVDPRRRIALHADSDRPTPTERRQADGHAGLILANDVYHRIHAERAGCIDLAREYGATWTEIGLAVGKSKGGAYKERVALARMAGDNDQGREANAASTVPAFWKGYVSELQRQITAFIDHADYFADDESITDWLDLLSFAGIGLGRQHFTFFLELVDELANALDCVACDLPQPPVATDDSGRRLCLRCKLGARADLGDLFDEAVNLSKTLIKERRASASYETASHQP
ncbi:hypothetical protein BS329_15605 [Amycolatopsis coloradensis]|uniref:Uncharacterized protein n=1 Tax=Amycolatopsis coloradensis TaxID=76021 RepID=A0A1R0KU80_9PSEU|nr:hypothetical protein [Amycolatopsis coloradensis]OLZ51689.1 hypothetical protein BS329_15605 [Amycolatopsis coloradensis]